MIIRQDIQNLPLNRAPPLVMHIDLNSCFAIIEQQANRLLRGKPVGVAAYDTPRGFILASSYQAKAKGIKLGVNVAEAGEFRRRLKIAFEENNIAIPYPQRVLHEGSKATKSKK